MSTTTAGDGSYSFTDLTPGSYSVREVQQAGYTQTAPAAGSYGVTVTAGGLFADRDFGNQVQTTNNDDFANRRNLGSGALVTDTGNNAGYTGETGEPEQSRPTDSAWWSWTAPSDGDLVVDTNGSNFDTFLTMATSTAVNALTVIETDDDDGTGSQSLISRAVTSATEYHFAVDGSGFYTGDITLNIAFTSASDTTPPTVTGRTPAPSATITTSSLNVDVTFDETVVGVDSTDLVLTGAAAGLAPGGASVGTPTNTSGTTWQFPIAGLVDGSLNVSLAPDANDIEDSAGNDLANLTWSYTVSLTVSPVETEIVASVDGYANDTGLDGSFETLDTTATSVNTRRSSSSVGENRGLLEFDISGISPTATVLSATFRFYAWMINGVGDPVFDVYGYSGNGAISLADATDYDSAADQVTFPVGDTDDKTVTVAVIDDGIVELSETFLAALSTATALGSRTTVFTDTGSGTILNDDSAGPLDLGAIDFLLLEHLNLAGSLFYRVETVYDGVFTLQIDKPTPPRVPGLSCTMPIRSKLQGLHPWQSRPWTKTPTSESMGRWPPARPTTSKSTEATRTSTSALPTWFSTSALPSRSTAPMETTRSRSHRPARTR